MHRTVHRNPLGGHTSVYFDEQRRVLRVERHETGENATLAWEGLYPTRLVDAGGASTQLTWQGGRIAAIATPSGNAIHYSYAPGGLSPDDPQRDAILRVEDSLGLVEARSYDAAGRPVAIENGAGETRTLGWNGAKPGDATRVAASQRASRASACTVTGSTPSSAARRWRGAPSIRSATRRCRRSRGDRAERSASPSTRIAA